jgi:outer membrane immunogenic protein
MKRFIALPILVLALIGLMQIGFAGPERYSGKELKQVAPAPEPECNWTGFHIGIHAGWAEGPLNWIDADTSIFPETGADTGGPETLNVQTTSGFIGGFQLGYDYQWHWLVAGVEGELSYGDVKSDSFENLATGEGTDSGPTNHFRSRNDYGGSIAGRLGFAWKKWLFYGKGGGAFAHTKYNFDSGRNTFSADETRFSPMVGAGIEYMINCNWSFKLEYQHAFFGTEAIDGTTVEAIDSAGAGGPEHESYDIDTQQNSVRVGLNYRF